MDVLPEHQAKIDKAIQFCQSNLKKFSIELEKHYGKKEADELSCFLLQNTYFAGGLFRSIFTDLPVNDVDIFFRSEDACVEFKTKFLQPLSIFTDENITRNETFIYKFGTKRQPYLSFITRDCGTPNKMLSGFDFTFNMHYYSVQDGGFSFDLDTFSKMGRVNNYTTNAINTLFRAFQFTRDGFQMEQDELMYVLQHIVQNNEFLTDDEIRKEITLNTTGPEKTNTKGFELTGLKLTDKAVLGGNEGGGEVYEEEVEITHDENPRVVRGAPPRGPYGQIPQQAPPRAPRGLGQAPIRAEGTRPTRTLTNEERAELLTQQTLLHGNG